MVRIPRVLLAAGLTIAGAAMLVAPAVGAGVRDEAERWPDGRERAAESTREVAGEPGRPLVLEVPITGTVDPFVARMVEREIAGARESGATAVLLRLDTPGGLDSAMRQIIKAVQRSAVPVVCWVGPSGARAASAGTFILVGCPVAAMAPGTNTGAAHPVAGDGGDILDEKIVNDSVAYIRALAERRDRNADWAERAVRQSASISAEQARRIGVIDLIASTPTRVLDRVDGRMVATDRGPVTLDTAGARLEEGGLSLGERLLHAGVDANIAFVIFIVGLLCLVAEMLIPGVGVAGGLGLILFVMALIIFGSLSAEIGGIVLLIAAFAFFVIEAHAPGIGVPAVAGVACFVLGGLFLYDGSIPGVHLSRTLLIAMAVVVIAFLALATRAGWRARNAPQISGPESLRGAEGVVTRALAPTGDVRVRGETWGATVGEHAVPLDAGSAIRVIEVRGLTLVVEAVDRPQYAHDPVTRGEGEL